MITVVYLEPWKISKIECLTKKVNSFNDYFCKIIYLRCLTGFSICLWIHRYTGIHMKVDIFQTDYSIHTKLRIFLYSSHIWKYKIQANKRLTKAKEKWSTVKFNVCVLSFIFLVPMFQTKWHACQQWHVSYGEDLSLECVSWIWHNQKFKILVSFWVDHSR